MNEMQELLLITNTTMAMALAIHKELANSGINLEKEELVDFFIKIFSELTYSMSSILKEIIGEVTATRFIKEVAENAIKELKEE